MVFAQTMGGAIFISVSQNILTSHLVSGITQLAGDLDPTMVVNTGATDLRNLVPAEQLPAVLEVYNQALRQVFLLGTGLASVSILGALGLEWKTVKKPEKATAEKDGTQDVEK